MTLSAGYKHRAGVLGHPLHLCGNHVGDASHQKMCRQNLRDSLQWTSNPVECACSAIAATLGLTTEFLTNLCVAAVYVVGGTGMGYFSLKQLARNTGPHELSNDEDFGPGGWPEITGMTTGTSVIGSALSFLLVFRLSWSVQRWWEARSLLGTATTKLRNLAVIFTNEYHAKNRPIHARHVLQTAFAVFKLYMATVIDDLALNKCAAYHAEPQRKRCLKNQTLETSTEMTPLDCAIARDLDSTDRRNIELSLAHTIKSRLTQQERDVIGDQRLESLITTQHRVLLCHAWLTRIISDGVVVGLVMSFEHEAAIDCQKELLQTYYSSLNIKKTPLPIGIRVLILIIKFTYCFAIYPHYMAYSYVMKLDQQQRESRILNRYALFDLTYIVLVSLGILFFVVLHIVANELDDPYGNDFSDLPLMQIRDGLWTDLDAISPVFNDELCRSHHVQTAVKSCFFDHADVVKDSDDQDAPPNEVSVVPGV